MVRLTGVEPVTHCLEGSCSIQLSYRRKWNEWFKGYQTLKFKKTKVVIFPAYKLLNFLVGAVRFELTAPWSQTKCATAALRPGQTTQMDAL